MKTGKFEPPKRLSAKLKDIRLRLGLSKEVMGETVG